MVISPLFPGVTCLIREKSHKLEERESCRPYPRQCVHVYIYSIEPYKFVCAVFIYSVSIWECAMQFIEFRVAVTSCAVYCLLSLHLFTECICASCRHLLLVSFFFYFFYSFIDSIHFYCSHKTFAFFSLLLQPRHRLVSMFIGTNRTLEY